MKKVLLIVSPLLLVIFGILAGHYYKGKIGSKDDWGIAPSELDASRNLWSEIGVKEGLISAREKDKLVARMREMLESDDPVATVQGFELAEGVVNQPLDKNNVTVLQKEELLRTCSGMLHGLATGDWNEYKAVRLPVNEYTLPANDQLAPYLSKLLGETNIQTKLDLDIHRRWFEHTFTKTPYFNSIQMLSSNAFAFTKWNKPINGCYAWDSIPQSGETKYIFGIKGDYKFTHLQELEIEKTKEILLCQFCFLAEGNPARVVRPYRIDMFWCTDAAKWVPIFLIRAFADYTAEGSSGSGTQETVRLLLF